MNETTTEPTENSKSGYPSNEETVKDVIRQLKNASLEISVSGNKLYHIFGMEQPTAAVYDTIPMLKGAIEHLEGLLNTE